ncbi:MAG: hypothetical protein SCK57_11215 [Bacillota bacterium]|nr:hypothetical protein [Bacillota bacterium]MDW7678221.1 hypothetical protein [Bacillota bacterium]
MQRERVMDVANQSKHPHQLNPSNEEIREVLRQIRFSLLEEVKSTMPALKKLLLQASHLMVGN